METSFQTAESEKVKLEIERRAYHYVADSLATIVNDIDSIGQSLGQVLDIETKAVDSLASQSLMINSLLHFVKETNNFESMSEFKFPNRDESKISLPVVVIEPKKPLPSADSNNKVNKSILERLNGKD